MQRVASDVYNVLVLRYAGELGRSSHSWSQHSGGFYSNTCPPCAVPPTHTLGINCLNAVNILLYQ